MESLYRAIDSVPIIDHHAHNLLLPQELDAHPLISMTTEAAGGALRHTTSTLSHIRAVRQLSEVLGCSADWESVQATIARKREEPDDAWARKCFEGIETVLVDDGLDDKIVFPWDWHHKLTRSKCKRIVRVEKVAETILKDHLKSLSLPHSSMTLNWRVIFDTWKTEFVSEILDALGDPDVVGFKSVICYRTGLALPEPFPELEVEATMARILGTDFNRLEDPILSPFFVSLAASLIGRSSQPKPFQFHTGLGDNDIILSLASPSHMQPFIKNHPTVPIVLLHSGYPFTKEAGYLASVYENVFLDIGEVFPMVSQDGQENILRESLELCPSEKLCWSTDGHWFPETYLLAVIQVREAMKQVLGDNVRRNSLRVPEAIKIVEDIFFNTSNHLYNLGLSLKRQISLPIKGLPLSQKGKKLIDVDRFREFLRQNPSVKYLRLQWLDYTATLRVRIIPVKLAYDMFLMQKSIGITKAVLGLIHRDVMASGFSPVGEYELIPCFEGLRLGARAGYATVQGEFREKDGAESDLCPRTILRRVVERAKRHGISFLVGFEVEVVFMTARARQEDHSYGMEIVSHGHSWSNAGALRNPQIMEVIEEIMEKLESSGINLQQIHPESSPGQYEFVTGPLPPLESVDTLLATRDIIYTVAENYSLRATFVPKPFPMACGTGAHVHMSISPETKYPSFYAGVLKHLPAIAAFTYSNQASYDRVQDGVWSGGRYVTWGTQNRETPLRKIEGSHWELKSMDGLANKYLAMAAILGAGLQGTLDDEPLKWKECTADPALMSEEERTQLGIDKMLPSNIGIALHYLGTDLELGELVGHELVDVYTAVKEAEMAMLDDLDTEDRRTFLIERY